MASETPIGGPEAPLERRVYRSPTNRVIAGVCGGLGEYLRIDPVLLRIAFVGLAFVSGSGIILYVIAWLVMPLGTGEEAAGYPVRSISSHQARVIVGGALMVIGVLMLGRVYLTWFNDRVIWSLLVIALGAVIAMKGFER